MKAAPRVQYSCVESDQGAYCVSELGIVDARCAPAEGDLQRSDTPNTAVANAKTFIERCDLASKSCLSATHSLRCNDDAERRATRELSFAPANVC